MSKNNIYSDVKPYLKVTVILLTVLVIQSNWDKIKLLSATTKQTAANSSSVSMVSGAVATSVNSDTQTAIHTEPTNDSKIKRIKNAVDNLIDTVKEKSGLSAAKGLHWGYGKENGPDKWATLTAAYARCKNGKNQSPINLVSGTQVQGFEPMFYYKNTGGEILNNGHTLKVIVKPGSFLRVLGKDYQLKQFHFHRMAEHTIDGRRYPMEVHLVHESAQGHIVVVAIMFEDKFQEFNMLVDRLPLPEQKGLKLPITGMDVDPAEMLPPRHSRQYYAYDGSLTTPPCTENVGWIVMKTPVAASLNRINRIGLIMKPNFRPVQPLNGRHVMYSR